MLQAQDPSLADFQNYEGCNEILNVTRPDIVRSVHDAYFEVGCDAVETNTFGANLGNLGEYDIAERTRARRGGRRVAREAADAWSTPERPALRPRVDRARHQAAEPGACAVRRAARRLPAVRLGLIDGGADACSSRPAKTCCRPRPRSWAPSGPSPSGPRTSGDRPGHRGDDRHHAHGLRDRRGARRPRAARDRRHRPQLRHRPGRDERAPAHLATHSPIPISVLPNAGLPELVKDGAHYPLTPTSWPPRGASSRTSAWPWSAAAAAPRPSTSSRGRHGRRRGAAAPAGANRVVEPVLPPCRCARTRVTCDRRAHQRQRLQGSSARRCSRRLGRLRRHRHASRSARAPTCSTCASTTSAATAPRHGASSPAASPPPSTLPLVLDSTEPEVIEAGLQRLGGRAIINSANLEDGDGGVRAGSADHAAGQGARRRGRGPDHRRGGPGPHRRVEGARRDRLIDDLTGDTYGLEVERHHRRLPHLPDRHRPGGDPPRRHRDHRGDPRITTELPGGASPPSASPT
jgi:5-methyltetrahydrofolate--homocysteine methyltransferase